MKLTVLIGLPASGKTRWAMENRKPNDIVVCRDDIRMSNYGIWHGDPIDENHVTKIERQQMIAAFENGYSVISANTNLNKRNVQRMVDLAAQFGAEVEYVYFELPPATCIEYDKHRDKKVGAKVINRMAKKAGINDKGWIPKHDYYLHKIEPYVNDESLPDCIVVDLDGTIARHVDRSPYDYSKVYTDEVIEPVWNIVKAVEDSGVEVVFLSGRNEECREETERWLREKLGRDESQPLFMRPRTNPNGPDFIVKDELLEQYVVPNYNILAVVDDRRQVVTTWETKGLTVLDVARNKF